ncbi:hypothetical protein [Methylobacterium sp. Gmos1]
MNQRLFSLLDAVSGPASIPGRRADVTAGIGRLLADHQTAD